MSTLPTDATTTAKAGYGYWARLNEETINDGRALVLAALEDDGNEGMENHADEEFYRLINTRRDGADKATNQWILDLEAAGNGRAVYALRYAVLLGYGLARTWPTNAEEFETWVKRAIALARPAEGVGEPTE